MILYSVCFVSLLFFGIQCNGLHSKNSKKTKKDLLFAVLIAALLITVFALRGKNVGIDTKAYKIDFEQIEDELTFRRYELGFYYFTYFIKKIGLSWQVYLLIAAIIMIFSLTIFCYKNSNNFFLSIFFFMTIGNFTMYLSGLRQSLAISFILLAIVVMENTKWKKWVKIVVSLALWALSTQFHISSIVFGIYFLLKIFNFKFGRIFIFSLILVAVLSVIYGKFLFKILSFIIPEKYISLDFNSQYKTNPLLIIVFTTITCFCALFIKTNENKKFDEKTTILLLFSILSLFLLCMGNINNQISRLMYYFNFSNILLIPLALSNIKKNDSIIFLIVIVLLCLTYFYITNIGGTLEIDNYTFFWED